MRYGELLLDDPFVVKTTHFLLSPECFVGIVAIKHGNPESLLLIDERLKVWSVPKDAVQRVEKSTWPKWAVEFIGRVNVPVKSDPNG